MGMYIWNNGCIFENKLQEPFRLSQKEEKFKYSLFWTWDDPYWTSTEISLKLIELAGINKFSLGFLLQQNCLDQSEMIFTGPLERTV
jgi:hypothetical protein